MSKKKSCTVNLGRREGLLFQFIKGLPHLIWSGFGEFQLYEEGGGGGGSMH